LTSPRENEHANEQRKWEEVCHRAVLEVDREKMPERIVAARQAIGSRSQGLYGNPTIRKRDSKSRMR
jgi:hypothetical protein